MELSSFTPVFMCPDPDGRPDAPAVVVLTAGTGAPYRGAFFTNSTWVEVSDANTAAVRTVTFTAA